MKGYHGGGKHPVRLGKSGNRISTSRSTGILNYFGKGIYSSHCASGFYLSHRISVKSSTLINRKKKLNLTSCNAFVQVSGRVLATCDMLTSRTAIALLESAFSLKHYKN